MDFINNTPFVIHLSEKFDIKFVNYIDWNNKNEFFAISFFFLASCLIFWFILHNFTYYLISSPIISIVRRLRNRTLIKDIHLKKFHISIWKVINYGLLCVTGLLVIWDGSYDHPNLGHDGNAWIYDYEAYGIPISKIPLIMVLHYQLTIASYIYGTYTLIFVEHRLKDFWQMLAHHVITLCVTIGSYYVGRSIRIGCIVMLLHDLSDPLLESAKCFNYIGWKRAANMVFVIFATIFIVLRCFIYPIYVIIPLFTSSIDLILGGYIYGYLLVAILILNLFWASLILKMIFIQILHGTVEDDIRED